MITALYLYILGGMISVWFTIESLNYEAKQKDMSARELHLHYMDNDEDMQKMFAEHPETEPVFRSILAVLGIIFILWFVIVLGFIFKLDKKD